MRSIDPDVLKRYAVGDCSAEERQMVAEWLDHDELAGEEKEEGPGLLKNEIWLGLVDQAANHSRVRWRKQLMGIAAGLILFASALALLKTVPKEKRGEQAGQQTYAAPPGKMVTLKLNDGTFVQLTGGSRFRYPIQFSGKTRSVILLSGEAFFNVKHNAAQPFIVSSSGAEIRVLGTRFNVSDLAGGSQLAVTLTAGRISFKEKGKQETILKPGQQLIFNKELNKVQDVKEVDTLFATGWRLGLLWFKQTPVREILQKLESYYGVTFETKGHPDLDVRLTGKFKQQPLSRILKLIENSSELRFEQRDLKIIIYKAN